MSVRAADEKGTAEMGDGRRALGPRGPHIAKRPVRRSARVPQRWSDVPDPANVALWERLPDELLDAVLNGAAGIDPVYRAGARLVCRRWHAIVGSPSTHDRRRLVLSAPHRACPATWCAGRYATASALASWAHGAHSLPSKSDALKRVRTICARVSDVDVATAVALCGRDGAVDHAVAMVGCESVGTTATAGSPPARFYSLITARHALGERIAGAAADGAAGVAVALSAAASLPSVTRFMVAAIGADRCDAAMALAGVAVDRHVAQRRAASRAVGTVVAQFWRAVSSEGAVACAAAMASALAPRNNGLAPAIDPPAADAVGLDLVAAYGHAPDADWMCSVASSGHLALLDLAHRCGWVRRSYAATMTAALCAGRIDACAHVAHWYAQESDGRFGPIGVDMAVQLVLHAVQRGRCSEAAFERGIAWLAASTTAVPVGALMHVLTPWPKTKYSVRLVDAWPRGAVDLGCLGGALAAYIYDARWTDADRLALSAASRRSEGSAHRTACFPLWDAWALPLGECASDDRSLDGGAETVSVLGILCAMALRVGAVDASRAPAAARDVAGCGGFEADDTARDVWRRECRIRPLSIRTVLAVRSFAAGTGGSVGKRAAGLLAWLADGGLCDGMSGRRGPIPLPSADLPVRTGATRPCDAVRDP